MSENDTPRRDDAENQHSQPTPTIELHDENIKSTNYMKHPSEVNRDPHKPTKKEKHRSISAVREKVEPQHFTMHDDAETYKSYVSVQTHGSALSKQQSGLSERERSIDLTPLFQQNLEQNPFHNAPSEPDYKSYQYFFLQNGKEANRENSSPENYRHRGFNDEFDYQKENHHRSRSLAANRDRSLEYSWRIHRTISEGMSPKLRSYTSSVPADRRYA